MSVFDTTINEDLHTNGADPTTMTVSDLVGGAVATTLDVGASLWNSLPGTPNVDTADLIKEVAPNALGVYEKNPETIHAASLVAGMFVPMGIATKGLALARAGARGASWWNYANKAEDVAKAASLLDQGAASTAEYRTLVRGIYTRSAVQQGIDSLAMEAAMVGMYNAHPLMEDYMKDPAQNFAISAVFGGVLGGAIGHIADRALLKDATGKVFAEAIDATAGKIRPIYGDMPAAVAAQTENLNVKNLQNLMDMRAELGKNETNDLQFALAKGLKQGAELNLNNIFENMISTDIKALEPEQKEVIKNWLVNNTETFGVDGIKFLTEKEVTAQGFVKAPKFDLAEKPSLVATQSSKGPIEPVSKQAVFYPEVGLYGIKDDAIHYAGASSLAKNIDQLVKDLPRNFAKIPNLDSSLELLSRSSAHIEADYIAYAKAVDSMSLQEFSKIHLSETDGPMLQAVVMRMYKDPEAAALGVKTGDRLPVYNKILKEHTEQLIAGGKMAPDATYTARVQDIGNKIADHTYSVRNIKSGISHEAQNLISGWIGGNGVTKMRKAFQDFFGHRAGGYGLSGADTVSARAFAELYDLPASVALRKAFVDIADPEGYVYLYRGQGGKAFGHASLASYSTSPSVAKGFGSTKLYRIKADDILFAASESEKELVVRAAAHQEAETATTLASRTATTKTTVTETFEPVAGKKASFQELQDMLVAQKQDAIDTLISNGMPFAAIAKKTNTDIKTVEFYALKRQDADFSLASMIHPDEGVTQLAAIKTLDDAQAALAPSKRPLVLSGNLRKNPYVENHIGLDNRTISNMNKELTAVTMFSSKSSAAIEMANALYAEGGLGPSLDIMRMQLGRINNALAGTAFFNSFDFFARNMGEVGPIASAVGKEIQAIGNRLRNKIVEPLKAAMSSVSKDPAALLEFNVAMDLNHSLRGYRIWSEDGRLLQKVMKTGEDGKQIAVMEPVMKDGQTFQVKSPSVLKLIHDMQDRSEELRNLTNTIRKIQGSPDVNDIGFWAPTFNPVNKFIAYARNRSTDETKLIWGRTQKEFDVAVRAYRQHLIETGQDKTIEVFTKNEQAYWSMLNGRLDTIHMERADTALQKAGSTSQAIVKTDSTILGELAGGYDHYITSQVRNLADINLADITDALQRLSVVNKAPTANQPLDKIKAIVNQPKDAAAIVRNTLIGNHNLGEFSGWKDVNSSFETSLSFASNYVSTAWDNFVAPISKTFIGGKKAVTADAMKKLDYEKLAADLEAKGIHNPFKIFDDKAAEMYGLSKLEEHQDTTKRIIYASNALAATVALRFGELAQPLVNMMSLPILTSLAIANKMPDTFQGIQKSTAKVGGVQIMYEGARAINSPLYADLNKQWEKLGYFKPLVSEMSDLMRASRSFEKGAIATIENGLDSKLVQIMSKPADYSETLVRKMAMNTGAVLAKRLYPELDDMGITIFARDFMDKAVGNFHASQRPVFFQGTLGVALGLFQTYTLTLGQSIYRHLELKNYKALGKAALMQTGIFGAESMPGFHQISEAIGNHFSDENVDLTTGTYRAIGDKAANFVLYGLPSNLGPAFNTRGDVNPRLPGVNGLVAYNFASQVGTMVGQIQKGLGQDGASMAQSLGEALSLQSMSRPLARTMELATRNSITKQGNTVQTPEEVWSSVGVFARILGTRPIEEQKLREADHLNRFYGSLDRDNRDEAMHKLKTALRNGTLSDEFLAKTAEAYMRNNGTPSGWRSAVNTALATTPTAGREVFAEKLKPNSPLQFMIHNMD